MASRTSPFTYDDYCWWRKTASAKAREMFGERPVEIDDPRWVEVADALEAEGKFGAAHSALTGTGRPQDHLWRQEVAAKRERENRARNLRK